MVRLCHAFEDYQRYTLIVPKFSPKLSLKVALSQSKDASSPISLAATAFGLLVGVTACRRHRVALGAGGAC
jgi:hypothetical protein